MPSFHLYMGPLVHPTNRDRSAACPSVRRGFQAFAGERMEGMAWNCACWCILATFRTDWIMVSVCWISSFYHQFDIMKWVKFGVSEHFPENAWENSLTFYMLMYLDHLQNWLVYGYSLLIFQILALFWFCETGEIWGFWPFPGERMEVMAWNFAWSCILNIFRTD